VCSASPFSHHHRKSSQECDVGHQRMPSQMAADRYRRRRVQAASNPDPDLVTGAVPGEGPLGSGWTIQAPRLPRCDPCISCSLVAPRSPGSIVQQLPCASQPRAGPWKPKPLCLFANFYCSSVFWKMKTDFLQPDFTCSNPILLDLLQTVLLWGMKGVYLFGSSGNMGGNC